MMADLSPWKMLKRRQAASAADVTLFLQELSWLTSAGIPLGRSIDLLLADARTSPIAPTLQALRADLRAGQSLSHALAGHPALFPVAYVRLVALAETAGTLPRVLERIHLARANAEALRRKVRSAMIYPVFLVLVAILAISVVMLAVVPQLKSIAPMDGAAKPSALVRLISLSDWLALNWAGVAVAGGVVVTGLALLFRRPAVRLAALNFCALLPVVGPLMRVFRLADLLRTLAMLTEAGLPFAEALRLGRTTTPAADLANAIADAEAALRAGNDIAAPLHDSGLVPPFLVSLIRVGMETGSIAQALQQAAQIFEEKTRNATDRALVLLEPAIILVISLAVGGIIYVIVDALFAVNDLLI